MNAPLSADGARPLVALVTALPREYRLTPGERLVLMLLACDSFDGSTAAPGTANLAAWSGMFTSSVEEILAKLLKPSENRPALLERAETTRGRRRTVYRLLLQPPGTTGVTAVAAELPGEPPGQPPGELPGEPPGHPGVLPSPSPSPFPNTTLEPPRWRAATTKRMTENQRRYLAALRAEYEQLDQLDGLEGIHESDSLTAAEADQAIKDTKRELYRLDVERSGRLGEAYPDVAAYMEATRPENLAAEAERSHLLSSQKSTTPHASRATA